MLHIEVFSAKFPDILSTADVAILQAGSTPLQILDSDIPIIVYVRDFKNKEQMVRANLLAKYDGVIVLDKEKLHPEYISGVIAKFLSAPLLKKRETRLNFNGIENATRFLIKQLEFVKNTK